MQVNHLKARVLEMVFICQVFVNLVLISMIVQHLKNKFKLGYAMIQANLELNSIVKGDLVLQPNVAPAAIFICTRIPMEKHML